MSVNENGLTLQGLAQRLEALERENERLGELERENTGLRQKVAALTGKNEAVVEPAWGSKGPVSRRALLGKAGAAAVAAMAAGMLLNPREAKADHYNPAISVNEVNTHRVNADNRTSGGNAIVAQTNSGENIAAVAVYNLGAGTGVFGLSASGNGGNGVKGSGDTGVYGYGNTGVWGHSLEDGYSGVYGNHRNAGYGVVGDGAGSTYAGVLGRNGGGEGVRGEGSTTAEVAGVRGLGKTGVWGSSSATGYSGVYGGHTGTAGVGVAGDGKGSASGVLGRNSSGIGVQGQGAIGVKGESTNGYGGLFQGAKAQLRLVPASTVGKPTTGAHVKGELYMDSAAKLFVCTVSGTPGTWRKVTTTLA